MSRYFRLLLAVLIIGVFVIALRSGQALEPMGGPSDVLGMPDGALLVADDQADTIYRISYHK